MSAMYATLLGIVQGIAEFLPISSSGHLVIVGAILARYSSAEIPAESTTMNVALHCGTLVAILIVYRHDLWELRRNLRLIGLVLLATVPVGAVGLLLKEHVEALFSEPVYAGVALLVTAAMLLISRKMQRPESKTHPVNLFAAVIIGVFQAVAIIPGISRSGSTIAAGLMCGLSRSDATRFSFLIAIPAIAGATLVKSRDFLTDPATVQTDVGAILIGSIVSLVVGVFALRLLIRIVVADRLHWFAAYCAAAGMATICWQMFSQ